MTYILGGHTNQYFRMSYSQLLGNVNRDLKRNIVSKKSMQTLASLNRARRWITAHKLRRDPRRLNKLTDKNKHKLTLTRTVGKTSSTGLTCLSVCLEEILPVRSVHTQSCHDVVPTGSDGLGVISAWDEGGGVMGLSGLHLEHQGQACPS